MAETMLIAYQKLMTNQVSQGHAWLSIVITHEYGKGWHPQH